MTSPRSFGVARDPRERMAGLQRLILEQRINKLVDALQRFTEEYNRGHGNVWPLREAELLRRAYHSFERSSC